MNDETDKEPDKSSEQKTACRESKELGQHPLGHDESEMETLQNQASIYSMTGQTEAAIECIEKLAELAGDDREALSVCYLGLGCEKEKQRDFRGAADYYREALALDPDDESAMYFIHNNLGFSLNQLEEFEEARPMLATAIEIEPRRPNAHKNLGLCLQGLGRYGEAAESFLQAAEACPTDERALWHLRELTGQVPELLAKRPDLEARLASCLERVAVARECREGLQ